MRRVRKMGRAALAALMAAALTAPAQVSAKPQELEYLEELAEAQEEMAQPSLLEQVLGLDGLSENMEDNGLSFYAKLGPTQETLGLLSEGAEIWDSCAVEVGAQIDPAQERWLFDLAALTDDEELLGATLYADREQLALSLPQLYDGAVGIRSGSFRRQYEGSVTEEILGRLPAEMPDVTLDFFPDAEELDVFGDFGEELEETVSDGEELIADGSSVAVREEDDQTVYTVSYRKQDVIRCVRMVMDSYMRMFRTSTLFTMDEGELDELGAELEEGCDVLELVLEDELLFDYYVEKDLVTKVHFDLNLDMNRLEPERPDEPVDAASPAAEYDPEYEAHFLCDLVYTDPADVNAGFELTVVGVDGAEVEHVRLGVSQAREQTDTAVAYSMRCSMAEEGEVLYDGEFFRTSFDAQTGDYDVRLHIEDEDTDMTVSLDGTFTEIQKGERFRFVVDEASLTVDGEKAALTGEIAVNAEPGGFDAPERVRMVMELSEDELISLATEIQLKGAILSQKLMPEPETEIPGAHGGKPETEIPGAYGEEPETEMSDVYSEKDV